MKRTISGCRETNWLVPLRVGGAIERALNEVTAPDHCSDETRRWLDCDQGGLQGLALNAALKARAKNKTHHHYVAVSRAEQTALTRPDVAQKLVAKLPSLSVIYFNSTAAGPIPFLDEYDLMTMVREFLTIPEHLNK